MLDFIKNKIKVTTHLYLNKVVENLMLSLIYKLKYVFQRKQKM